MLLLLLLLLLLQDIGPKEQYYLLCDALPEDRQLREKLQNEKLVSEWRNPQLASDSGWCWMMLYINVDQHIMFHAWCL